MYSIPVFLITFSLFFHPIIDFSQDLGRHIKLGEIIWLQAQSCAWLCTFVPKINLFAYTYPNFPFINTHWLSEVIFYLLRQHFGTYGLLLLVAILPTVGMTLLFSFTLKRTNFFVAFVALCAYLTFFYRTYLRPELFSIFFVAVFVVILYRNREKLTKWIFLLPILELLWVNMHIYFPVGILLIGLFFIDQVVVYFIAKKEKRETKNEKQNLLLLSFILLLSSVITLINPSGLTGALYPFNVLNSYSYQIEENQSLFFLISYGLWRAWYGVLFVVTSLFFFLLVIYRKQTTLIDWLLPLIFTVAAFQTERNISLFFPATLISFTLLLSKLPFFSKQSLPNTRYKAVQIGICVFLAIGVFVLNVQANGFGLFIQPTAEKGADFFISHHIKGPIFNDFDIGSYLDYRLYPNERVFIDGRPEAYPVNFSQNVYIPMQYDAKVFEEVDKKYHFQSIFFAITDQTEWAEQFFSSIMTNPKWQLVYLDTFSAIWVKKDGINNTTAMSHPVTQKTFDIPQDPGLSAMQYFQLVHFLDMIGWKEQKTVVYQKVLDLDPNNCTALGILVQNPQTSLLYQGQYIQSCH